MSELRTWRVWYDGRPGVNSLFQINPEVTNHLPEEFRVVHFDDYDALRAQLEQTQKMLADRIVDYTQAQGRLEIAVKALEKIKNSLEYESYDGGCYEVADKALSQITERFE